MCWPFGVLISTLSPTDLPIKARASGEVMERLMEKAGSENIYRTDEHGTIELITDGEKLWVRVAR